MKINSIIRAMILGSTIIALAAGCGDDDDETSPTETSGQQPQTQADRGVFTAQLADVNNSVSGNTSGAVEITVNGDEMTVRVQVNGAPVATHAQAIHTGTVCPTATNDTNADGIMDAVETNNVSGKILIPFDDDINTQDSGKDGYPAGPIYTYNKSGSYSQILSDLVAADANPNDAVVKLPSGTAAIGLKGKVIIVRGVPPTVTIPSTVASDDPTKSPHAALPVACGTLKDVIGDL